MATRPATTFLRIALRRAAQGTGSSRVFLERRTAMQSVPNLGAILDPIDWVLVGGIALRAYMPERMTLDVDILVHERDAFTVRKRFTNAGYRVIAELTIGGFSVQSSNETEPPVDVITRADTWLDSALASPSFDLARYPVLGRPYLLLLKLQAGRSQDLADVQRLLSQTSLTERSEIRALIIEQQSELAEDFDSLCTLADLEFGSPPAEIT